MSREVRKAVVYLRTSSKTNVGPDKDSDKRQLAAITAYAKAAGFEVVDTFYDAAVSGADPVTDRLGFGDARAADVQWRAHNRRREPRPFRPRPHGAARWA